MEIRPWLEIEILGKKNKLHGTLNNEHSPCC